MNRIPNSLINRPDIHALLFRTEAADADIKAAEISYKATVASVDVAQKTAMIQTDRFSKGRLSAADLVDAEAALSGARSSRALALTH
ncbi:MAG: TolC family protein [Deltaproteobacteria bacterium]|nr:TolC family protein [Deltaproteobacteria bacterium]